MVDFLIRWKGRGLKVRRSDKEKEMIRSGFGASLTEEQLSKLDFLERKLANEGVEHPLFLRAKEIDKIK